MLLSFFSSILMATESIESCEGSFTGVLNSHDNGGKITFTQRVSTTNDDAEESSNGSIYRDSSDLELTEDGSKHQTIGIRFQEISIPKNVTITKAYIQFSVDETSSGMTNLTIRGEDVDSANYFSSNKYDITSRIRTSTSASWSPPAWSTKHEAGSDQQTSDLTAIVQEIVNRGGWSSGNSMAFIITGSGNRVAESYNGESDEAPLLHIEFNSCYNDDYTEEDNNSASTAMCYALPDNSSALYKVMMSPDANPLPFPQTLNISKVFDGEGSAYRASNHTLYAFDEHSNSSDLYTINLTTGSVTEVKHSLLNGSVEGAEFYYNPIEAKEILYVTSEESHSKLYAFYADTWIPLNGYPKNIHGSTTSIDSIAINPATGEAYASDDYEYDGISPNIHKLNLKTAETTFKIQVQGSIDAEGLAYASDGELYVEDESYFDGRKIYKINLETGELTPSAFLGGSGDVEGISCNGTAMAIEYPTIKIDTNSSVVEGNSSTTDLNFLVTLSKPAVEDVTFSYTITDESATANEDYIIESNLTAIIPKDSSSTTISIQVKGDRNVESDETILVNVIDATNAVVDSSSMVGTILNDDEETPAELMAEYRFDACQWGGVRTDDNIKIINRSGKFNGHQSASGNDELDEIFGTSSSAFTITTWIYPKTLLSAQTNHITKNTFIAKASDSKNDNLEIGVNPNGTVHVYLDTKSKDAYADFGNAGDITINSWHFVAVGYDNGVVTVQIDDKTYTNSTTWSGATTIDPAVGSPFTLGASLHIDNFFDGYIDEVKVFKTSMSSTQLTTIRNHEREGKNWDGAAREASAEDCSLKPIGCIESAWMFQNRPTDINALNLVNGVMGTVKADISLDNINAVGYNKKDNYFWGYNYSQSNGTITRIGLDNLGEWIAEDFKIAGLDGFSSYVGDVDNSGHLYLKEKGSSSRTVVIDLDPSSSTYLTKIREFNLSFALNVADWGFNPQDNMLYAVNNGRGTKKLYKIDPATGQKLSQQDTNLTGNRGFGASFFDANGFYYIYDNNTGNIFRIDVAKSAEAVLFSSGDVVRLNDGAMCTDVEFKFDFGDAPENYLTTLKNDGARHSLPVYGEPIVYLGSGVDHENDGEPSEGADLDMLDDGVRLNGASLQGVTLSAGTTTTLSVKTHGEGVLNAWIDWNGDGDFEDAGEQIAQNITPVSGLISFDVMLPSGGNDFTTYARFRYSSEQNVASTGLANDGEVEDYKINIHGNLEPFTCNDKLYLSNRTELGAGSGDSGATWLHSFNAMGVNYAPIGDGFTSSAGGYNALGYNVKDNFMYALYGNELLKIDKNANVKNLGAITDFPNTQLYAGEFDRDGFYYVTGTGTANNTMYKIDIAQKKVVATITLSQSVRFWDMAIDTTGEYFYTMLIQDGDSNSDFQNNKFAKIKISDGTITTIGDFHNDLSSYISLIFSDAKDQVIALSQDGKLYEIMPQSGKMYFTRPFASLSYYNDGTICADANITLPPHPPRLSINDVTKVEGDSGVTNFNFTVSIDADLPMMPMGMPSMFYYKVVDGDGKTIAPAKSSDNDFKGGSGFAMKMNIFATDRTHTITVPVYGDTKVEADEAFYVEIYFPEFFPSSFCTMGKSRGVGTILNDDMKIIIERSNSDEDSLQISKESLYTQISGRDFDYSIVSYGEGRSANPIEDITFKIELIDNNSTSKDYLLYDDYFYIESGARLDIEDSDDLKLSIATRDASFRVSYLKDVNGSILRGRYDNEADYNRTKNSDGNLETTEHASDHFAVRPANYRIELQDIDENNNTVTYRSNDKASQKPLNLIAEYDYRLNVYATIDGNDEVTAQKYTHIGNEELNATLIFDDKSTCYDTNDSRLNYRFDNGVITSGRLSHNNVGAYTLHIEDVNWTSVDQNSDPALSGCIVGSAEISNDANSKSGCNIVSNDEEHHQDIKIDFQPYAFNLVNTALSNANKNGKNYLYMGDLAESKEMGVEIRTDIIVQGKKEGVLTNFTKSCVAKDVLLSLDYTILSESGLSDADTPLDLKDSGDNPVKLQQIKNLDDHNGSVVSSLFFENITISSNNFLDKNEGNTSVNLLYNIQKSFSETINPVQVNFKEFDANATTIEAKMQGKDVTPNKVDKTGVIGGGERVFYFSAVIPDKEVYPETAKKIVNTPLTVEIYCKATNNRAWCDETMNLKENGLNGFRTDYGWYTAKNHDSSIDGHVIELKSSNPDIITQPTNIPNVKNGRIEHIQTKYAAGKLPNGETKSTISIVIDAWLRFSKQTIADFPVGTPYYTVTMKNVSSLTGIGDSGLQTESTKKLEHNGKLDW